MIINTFIIKTLKKIKENEFDFSYHCEGKTLTDYQQVFNLIGLKLLSYTKELTNIANYTNRYNGDEEPHEAITTFKFSMNGEEKEIKDEWYEYHHCKIIRTGKTGGGNRYLSGEPIYESDRSFHRSGDDLTSYDFYDLFVRIFKKPYHEIKTGLNKFDKVDDFIKYDAIKKIANKIERHKEILGQEQSENTLKTISPYLESFGKILPKDEDLTNNTIKKILELENTLDKDGTYWYTETCVLDWAQEEIEYFQKNLKEKYEVKEIKKARDMGWLSIPNPEIESSVLELCEKIAEEKSI